MMKPEDMLMILPTRITDVIARWYPLSKRQLLQHAHKLDSQLLRKNTLIKWDRELLQKVLLSYNAEYQEACFKSTEDIPLDKLVLKYDETLSSGQRRALSLRMFKATIHNVMIPGKYAERALRYFGESSELEDYLEVLDIVKEADFWKGISTNKWISWTPELIRRYKYHWAWYALSRNRSIPWDKDMVDEFEDRIVWYELAGHPSFPWNTAMIYKVLEKDDYSHNAFNHLSGVEEVPWTERIIDQFADKWWWHELSFNEGLPWSEELIHRYEERLVFGNDDPPVTGNVKTLSSNRAVPWTVDLLERYKERLNWGGHGLSWNPSLPWSIELLERFEDKFDWSRLSQNTVVTSNMDILMHFKSRWNWEWVNIDPYLFESISDGLNETVKEVYAEASSKALTPASINVESTVNEWRSILEDDSISWRSSTSHRYAGGYDFMEFFTKLRMKIDNDDHDSRGDSFRDIDFEELVITNKTVWEFVIRPILSEDFVDKMLQALDNEV